jgi:hypothetical protein
MDNQLVAKQSPKFSGDESWYENFSGIWGDDLEKIKKLANQGLEPYQIEMKLEIDERNKKLREEEQKKNLKTEKCLLLKRGMRLSEVENVLDQKIVLEEFQSLMI